MTNEAKRDETKRNEKKRDETRRNEAKRSETKQREDVRRCCSYPCPHQHLRRASKWPWLCCCMVPDCSWPLVLGGVALPGAPRRWLSYCCLCIATMLVTYGSGTGITLNSRAALWLWCCMVLARLCLTACGAASALATKVTTHGSTAWSHDAMGLCHASSAV